MTTINLDGVFSDWMARGLIGAVAAVVALLFVCGAVDAVSAMRSATARPRLTLTAGGGASAHHRRAA
jgi:hypothetical protein